MSSVKVVQTEVDMETYKVLRAIAIHKGTSLKEVLREILKEYAENQEKELLREIHEDPFWKGIGLLKIKDRDESEEDTWGVVEWSSE